MIPQQLIESALQLTGRKMEDMNELNFGHHHTMMDCCDCGNPENIEFSIEKFCYYLLSKQFLSEYEPYYGVQFKDSMRYRVGHAFQEAITAYQDGDEELLIQLLSKINEK